MFIPTVTLTKYDEVDSIGSSYIYKTIIIHHMWIYVLHIGVIENKTEHEKKIHLSPSL